MKRVVVALIQDEFEGEKRCFLIASRKEFGQWTGHYYPPGGHVEADETDEQALGRELREELGVEMRGAELLEETPGDVEGQVTAWYSCAVEGIAMPNKEELADGRFFTVAEIEQLPLWPATETFLGTYFLGD